MGAIKRHILTGIGGGLGLIAAYLGILSLTQGLSHAIEQAAAMWYWILALSIGFGIQIGLFSFIRHSIKASGKGAAGTVAVSGGVSGGSMLACCVHHLSDVVPLVGIAGAAVFMARYQSSFLVLGVLSNAVGVVMMLETIKRHDLCPWVARIPWNLGSVKISVMILSAVAVLVSFSITAL